MRRRQILDAAARLATEEGLEQTSIAKVAAAAGMAKGSIYLHFESRQDLIAGLQADLWDRLLDVPLAIVADDSLTSTERLDTIVEHWMRFEYDHHGLYHEVFHTVATDSDEPLVRARSLLGEVVAQGAADGEFDVAGIDTDVLVDFLLHAYLGPCFHGAESDAAIANVQRLFRRVVGSAPP